MGELAQIRAQFAGLGTALGPEAAAPGALLDATNVVIRKPGLVEPRPGFDTTALPAALASTGAAGHVEYNLDSNEAGLIMDGAATLWDGYSGFSAAVTKQGSGSALAAWESYAGQVARKSLFLTTADALRVVHAPGATTAYRAGTPQPGASTAVAIAPSGSGPAFATDARYRAYRAVIRRDDVSTGQSHISRSAPSNRVVLYNATAPKNATVRIELHKDDDFIAGDVIELYSTEQQTTYPTDEMYLGQEHVITASDKAAGYVDLLDDTADNDLGAALYTNDSREGGEGAHYRPPMAGAIALFNNSLWLGDLTYPPAETFSFRIGAPSFVGVTGTNNLIGFRIATGTFTNGSADITAVSAGHIATVKVGMLLSRVGFNYADSWSGASSVRVTAVGATSFTVNATWGGATTTLRNALLEDSIKIDTVYYPAEYVMQAVRRGLTITSGYVVTNSSLYTADYLSDSPLAYADGDSRLVSLRISTLLPTTTAPQVWATNGALYSPALPEPTVGTGYTLPQEILPDHVAWSNQDEPDHFRLDNIERVGGGGSTVMAMAPSGNSILLFTDTGAFRASGYADSGISFDDLDPAVRIIGRRCAAATDRKVYVLADAGAFECDENTCSNITTNVLSDMDGFLYQAAPGRATTAHAIANGKDDEILFCLPTFYNTTPITRVYVFNTLQRAWTKWTLPLDTFAWTVKGRNRLLTATISAEENIWVERLLSSGLTGADRDFGVTITAVGAGGTNVIDIAAASGWTPVVGDVVYQSGTYYSVTEIFVNPLRFTVHQAGLQALSAIAYEGITSVVTPTVNTLKQPHLMKVWAEGAFWWKARTLVRQFTLSFKSAISGASTADSQVRLLSATLNSNADTASAPAASRFLVPRAAARGTHMAFTVTIRQALSQWALEGIVFKARTTSDRPPARLA